jgi:NAD(P)-dependent dehydrogenase (short-subunit alcohol dehydrogenase family)
MSDLSLFSIAGRTALVTGASRGIGRAIAIALAKAGADLAITARAEADLHSTCREIGALGRRVVAIAQDVSDPASATRGVETAISALGALDILVNNAGTEEVRPSTEVDEALWNKIVDTNLKGAFFCAQAAARDMIAHRRGGSIINLLSLTSEVGVPTAVPYGASKTGLLGMTRALAAEWAPHGIRVNGIAPGYFRTALTDMFYSDKAWQDRMLAGIPLGRFGKLDDLAGAAVFLASPASAYVTGIMLPVDGGILAAL